MSDRLDGIGTAEHSLKRSGLLCSVAYMKEGHFIEGFSELYEWVVTYSSSFHCESGRIIECPHLTGIVS